jgi:hypothetical protein
MFISNGVINSFDLKAKSTLFEASIVTANHVLAVNSIVSPSYLVTQFPSHLVTQSPSHLPCPLPTSGTSLSRPSLILLAGSSQA